MIKTKHTDDYYYDIIRTNIRKYRKKRLHTNKTKAELSVDYICEIESKKRKKSFSIATLGRIADVLDIKIEKSFEEIE